MAFYRQVGDVPGKRHTVFREDDGALRYEELMGEEGFSSDSSLLYHRGVPSAIVDSQVWELPDLSTKPNHPLKPRHLRLHSLFEGPTAAGTGIDAVQGRQAGPGQRRRADLLRGRHGGVAVLPQRDRRRVRLRPGGVRRRRDGVRRAAVPHRRLRDRAARHHAPVGAGRGVAPLRHRGEQPHRAAQALPVALRPAARARALLRAGPLRSGGAVPRRGRGRRGAGQASRLRAVRVASSARG